MTSKHMKKWLYHCCAPRWECRQLRVALTGWQRLRHAGKGGPRLQGTCRLTLGCPLGPSHTTIAKCPSREQCFPCPRMSVQIKSSRPASSLQIPSSTPAPQPPCSLSTHTTIPSPTFGVWARMHLLWSITLASPWLYQLVPSHFPN